MHKRKAGLKDHLSTILIFPAIILIWELADYVFQIKEIVLPNPHEIFFAIVNNFNELIYHTGITTLEAVLGFIAGSLFSIILAMIFVYSKPTKKAVYPYMIVIKAVPMLVFAPLLILWFGNGLSSKVVMAALVAFFPVLVNSVKGFSAVEEESLDLFRSLSASRWQVFLKLRLPSALKFIFPSLKIATTFAVVGATIAEFTGASAGIGNLITNASYYLDTSLMFGGIAMISASGVLLFYLINWIEKRIVFWEACE